MAQQLTRNAGRRSTVQSLHAVSLFGALLLVAFAESKLLADVVPGVSFWPIGSLSESGFFSDAFAVSGDGNTVVGHSAKNGVTEAITWTKQSGMTSLGKVDGKTYTAAGGISYDGQVILVQGYTGPFDETVIFRWTPESGLAELNGCGCDDGVAGSGVSADGRSIIGRRRSGGFIWTAETGAIDIAELPIPQDLTPDGRVVVGVGFTSAGQRGFKWTSETGPVELGSMMKSAYAVSDDGSVIAGIGSDDGQNIVIWTEEGSKSLGHLPGLQGRRYSVPNDISGDGTVIVGGSGGVGGFEAYRWTATSGMTRIRAILDQAGIDMTGWTLSSANSVSTDGSVIVGSGVNPDGQQEGWVAVIPPHYVPEPRSAIPLFIGAAVIIQRFRPRHFRSV